MPVIRKESNSSSSSGGLIGTWNASTNTPALSNTDTGKLGIMYQVSTGGSVDFGAGAITFEAKDIVINNGTTWEKIGADASSTFVQDPTTKAIKVANEVGTTGNARGTNAVDLQVSRSSATQVASGTSSFNVGLNCTASGNYSTASGNDTTASGLYSTASGGFSTASGNNSTASGNDTTASGLSSTASGSSSTASGSYSTASGSYSTAYLQGQFANSSVRITTDGDSQYSFFVVRERTTNATPIVMTLGADGILVRAVLPSGKTWRFVIELVAKNTSNGDTFAATYVGAIKRVGSTTSLVGTVTERDKVNDAGASTWSVAVTANDTNESLEITVTGAASTTINWCAVVHLTEVA